MKRQGKCHPFFKSLPYSRKVTFPTTSLLMFYLETILKILQKILIGLDLVSDSPRTSALTTVMVGARRLGPQRGTEQYLVKYVSPSSQGVGDIGVKGEEALDLGDLNSKDGPKKVVSKPQSSYQ